jgi:hypothetical protein
MRKNYQAPDEPAEPSPHITPEMLRSTMHALESRGMILYGEGGAYIPTEKGWKLLMSVGSNLEEVGAHGHPNISATDSSVIKIIVGKEVDKSVVGVNANKSCATLNSSFKENLKGDKKIEIVFDVDGMIDVITAYCSPALKVSSDNEIVVRKDDKIDDGTVAIFADKAASELSRDTIERLKDPKTKVKIRLEIK